MTAGRRAALAGLWVVGVALIVGTTLRPALRPLTERTALPPAAQLTDAGIPVPSSAGPCALRNRPSPGSVPWCMPSGVSAAAVHSWFLAALPPGRDARNLRWCSEERKGDGRVQALWSTPGGLAGYTLPPRPPRPLTQDLDDPVAVEVVTVAGATCPPAARASRERG